jgi:hypothetical protein
MPDNALAKVLDPNDPEILSYRSQAPELLAVAQSLTITSDAGLIEAAEHTKLATSACRAIRDLFKPAKKALNDAKIQIAGLEAQLAAGFEQADTILRNKVVAYRNEQTLRALAERRRKEEEERKRREDDQLAQAARLETMARTTGQEHYERAAQMVLNQPVRVAILEEQPVTPKGLSFREETAVEVTDIAALIAAVAAGAVDSKALLANTTWLRNEAKQRGTAIKDGDELCPGVVVIKTPDVTVRTR